MKALLLTIAASLPALQYSGAGEPLSDQTDLFTARQAGMRRFVSPVSWELYDLESDPVEFDNLSKNSAFVAVATRLKQALRAWQTRTQDPFTDAEFRKDAESKYSKSSNLTAIDKSGLAEGSPCQFQKCNASTFLLPRWSW